MASPLRRHAIAFSVLSAALGLCPLANAQDARPEMAWVNQDAFFFLHLRPAAVWNGDIGATLRKQIGAPANFAEAGLQQVLGIAPGDMESFTFVGSHLESTLFLVGGVKRAPVPRGVDKDFDFKKEDKSAVKDPKKCDPEGANEVSQPFGRDDGGVEDKAEYFMNMGNAHHHDDEAIRCGQDQAKAARGQGH